MTPSLLLLTFRAFKLTQKVRLAARFDWLCEQYQPSSKVPAVLTCVDIAGLTKGASTGAGLGNNFLANVRAVDGIFQVVRKPTLDLNYIFLVDRLIESWS